MTPTQIPAAPVEEAPRIKARSRSAFAEQPSVETKAHPEPAEMYAGEKAAESEEDEEALKKPKARTSTRKTSEELRQEIFGEEIAEQAEIRRTEAEKSKGPNILEKAPALSEEILPEQLPLAPQPVKEIPSPPRREAKEQPREIPIKPKAAAVPIPAPKPALQAPPQARPYEKLGPTGRHIKDLLPQRPKPQRPSERAQGPAGGPTGGPSGGAYRAAGARHPLPEESPEALKEKARQKSRKENEPPEAVVDLDLEAQKKGLKVSKFKEFKDIKRTTRRQEDRSFDARDRQGLRVTDEEGKPWRKKRSMKMRPAQEDLTVRPTQLKVRLPISIKDLASEMKLKSSQLIQKLFLQGVVTP